MTALLILHFLFISIWLGCVLTEVFFERVLSNRGNEFKMIQSELRKRVNFFVEIPALTATVITGSLMLPYARLSGLLAVKIGIAMTAAVANLFCVWLACRRHDHALVMNWTAFDHTGRWQHVIGAFVLLGIIVALTCGLQLFTKYAS